MLRPLFVGAAAAALVTTCFAPAANASKIENPPPDKIVIDLVTVNGSGCPAGTAAVAVSPDNTAFTVTYSDYLAKVGVGASPTDFRKNCQLDLDVHVPQGFTYAVAEADYRGFAHLENGATGLERANYYFQGMQQTAYISHDFSGALDDDWQTTDTTDVASLVWAPCGEERNFNVNTELRVGAGTSDPTKTTSFMTMDSADGSITTTYHLAWKQCPTA
ncbi:DUF4360 domain-containing protein [Streptantibioticus cattleyicolor]|uniref:Secreted protein n=1 Tax=Streptantibioticus cattleyicolor (strain ATCC 35852 / DSM 46488 / JCM 4925 / NBRC 14057 / NRRL 8057) TaxID=1003195 RepID=F8JJW8_STREN|nr:DUF4360 domain-containing protein [Streptantibioticus cattleyicolor]AEW98604.1 secreted protein [Streptantibioticus cattleyicolor NRRL 8057 = DSM 46488]CCB72337.1 conserved exported protein of unknown function [Streptantibioticus cattleyicolor NRRL 8057 = DSM 46488]